MVDSAAVFDLEGEKIPDLFGILSAFLLIILIADIRFTGFRLGELGIIVVGGLFLITLIAGFGFINIPFTEGHLLDGVFGFTLGTFLLDLFPDLFGFNFSFLSQATASYLAGVLPSDAGVLIDITNKIFAPLGETFLIFGFAAGIQSIVEATRYSRLPLSLKFLIVGLPPSLLFAVLHGGRGIGFFLFAFTINMVWTGLLYFEELTSRSVLGVVPVGLGLIAGLHFGNNLSAGSGLIGFINTLGTALSGDFNRSAAAILIFLGVTFSLGALRGYQILQEEVL